MKVYVIVGCFSGVDFSNDDSVVYEVCSSLEQAKIDFENIINDIKDGFSTNCEHGFLIDELVYEYTDFDYDEHGIIKLVEQELK